MWNCGINCTEIIDIVLASSYKQFFNNWKITLNYLKLFKFRIKSTFVMKTFYMIVHHFESIRTILVRYSGYCFDATIKRQHNGVLCIFVSQYIIGRSFCLSVTTIPKLDQYLNLVFIMLSFDVSTLE